jgi:hypothetical protein
MYQDAKAWRLVVRAFENAPGWGTDIAVTVSRRSGNC